MITKDKRAMEATTIQTKEDRIMNTMSNIESKVFNDRIIYLFGTIDTTVLSEFLNKLMYLESIDNTREITIYINADGDDLLNGFAIYDYIDSMQTPVKTICIGKAQNAGAIAFLAGKKRIMSKYSVLVILDTFKHNMDFSIHKADEIEKIMEKLDKLSNMLSKIILDNSRFNLYEICDMLNNNELLFTQHDAEEAGIVTDKIAVSERRKNE